jgi:hypothetical protein
MPRPTAYLLVVPLLAACGLFFPEADDGGDVAGDVDQDVFVAVGDAGALISSPDGVTWTTRTSGVGGSLNDVAWGPGVDGVGTYVVVGNAGVILTSTNGLDWLSGSSPSSRDLRGVVHHIDRFFAVGGDYSAGAETLVSLDGNTWTRPDIPPLQHLLTGLASNGSTLVAIGNYRSDLQTFGAFTWAEGSGWQVRIDAGASGTTYAAVAAGIPAFALIGSSTAATSKDAATWLPSAIVGVPPMHGLVYSALGWVAVGDGGIALTAPDAFLWSSPHITPITAALRGVTSSGGQYIAVGDTGVILSSLDGVTWTSIVPPLAVNLRAVTHPLE